MIEILYPEICNLYGDYGNILLLEQTFGKKNIKYTHVNEIPYFVNHKVKLIYMASMSKNNETIVIEQLKKYQNKLAELIETKTYFLLTGTALNIFAKTIKDEKEEKKGLDLLDITVTKKDERINCLYMGMDQDTIIVGFKSQFQTNKSNEKPLFQTRMGIGHNQNDKKEGIKKRKLLATNLLGPFLILNPIWTKKLFKKLGYEKDLPFEKELMDAYQKRLEEYLEIEKKHN